MALAQPLLPEDASVLLRFGGVELDAARHRLVVDGREVRVQRLVLHLLRVLCEADGRVLSRDELFAKLWPDGTFPADESLSQLVFKLRNALGPYASAVVTVRQVGVRLDAQVERTGTSAPEWSAATAAAEAGPLTKAPPGLVTRDPPAAAETIAAPPPLPAVSGGSSRPRVAIAVLALAVLALVVGWVALRGTAPVVVSAGFGLTADEVQASDPRTVETLQRAFEADADGNQAAARVLMETAHATDPRTPVPAMFLTYWYGGVGETEAGQRWAAERDRRIGPDTPTYVALLARFLSIRDAPALERLKLEALLLEMRPGAALIRLARAHQHLQRNERALALEQLRGVDLRAAGRRRAPIVLGDRASLGDLEAVEAALAAPGDALDAPGLAYATARLRVSEGRWAEARAAFDRAQSLTQSAERPDQARNGALHAAMMSAELGEFADARTRLERSIQALRDEQAYAPAWIATLILATLPNVSADEASALFARLAVDVPESARGGFCMDLELAALQIRVEAPAVLRCAATGGSDAYAQRGGSALLEGLHAQLSGDAVLARAALARAESEGVRETVLAPYADLLVARLDGTPQQAAIPDPPYPLWHRWALRWRRDPPLPAE